MNLNTLLAKIYVTTLQKISRTTETWNNFNWRHLS